MLNLKSRHSIVCCTVVCIAALVAVSVQVRLLPIGNLPDPADHDSKFHNPGFRGTLPQWVVAYASASLTRTWETLTTHNIPVNVPHPPVVSHNQPLQSSEAASTGIVARAFRNPMRREVREHLNVLMTRSRQAEKHARQLLRGGNFAEAEVECRRAMALSPIINGKPWYGNTPQLLGEINLAQGNNQEALVSFLEARVSTHSLMLDLNTALAYCRLGNFGMAKKHYPSQTIVNLTDGKSLAEWPQGDDLRSLEASILLAQGLDAASSADATGALPYLRAAGKLAPQNWFIAEQTAYALDYLNRRDDAVPYYRRAIELGGDKVSYEHRMRVEMYDLRKKQASQRAAVEPSTPR